MAIRIIIPQIFKDAVICGVTERNPEFPPFGLTFSITPLVKQALVRENFRILAKELGVPSNQIFSPHQIHSNIVHVVNSNYKSNYCDALITNVPNYIIGVKIADCAGILIFDPVCKVVSAVHSGWRGTLKEILPRTIEKMTSVFNSNPKNLLVYISPLASVENYEVGKEFENFFPYSIVHSDGKIYFDNKKELISQLINSGVKLENIEVSDLCTIANENLHSYRRDREKSGRMFAFIGLKE
ncbi:MAG: peptidoglycan editing factor PgeF [Candidatus Kapaibacteriales bacterium]